jgi:hypothetical protein
MQKHLVEFQKSTPKRNDSGNGGRDAAMSLAL